jgi:hypothetical protein
MLLQWQYGVGIGFNTNLRLNHKWGGVGQEFAPFDVEIAINLRV